MSTSITIWQVRITHPCQWHNPCATSGQITVDAYIVHETNGTPSSVKHQGSDTRCVTCHPFTEAEQQDPT